MRESSIILKAFMVFAGVILFIPYIFIISDANLEYHNPQTKIWMLSIRSIGSEVVNRYWST